MIRAKYIADGNTHTLSVVGHANYARYGQDIVCAGASSLVQALIGWIEYNEYNIDASVDEHNGEYIISATGGEDVFAVFYMTAIGLEQIQQSYPDHISINIIGLDD